MKEFFIGFLLGIVLTTATGGYFVVRKNKSVKHAQDVAATAIQRTADAVETKLVAWHLTTGDIEKELTDTGKVVRRQMSDFGEAVADAASDTKITGKIKAKLALDKELSVLGISVNTTDGRVTLSGNVTTSKQISRAMMLALETDDVREVSSTLKVKTKTAP
jgi:hyperosmotically inducible periplasmic protein